jgi:hypothetical protein
MKTASLHAGLFYYRICLILGKYELQILLFNKNSNP